MPTPSSHRYTTLGAEQLQEGFKRLSSQTLNVSMFTLFAQYLMKVKSVPKDFVPDDGRPHGPLERYWTALSRGSGPAIVLNIVVNTAIVLAVLPEWLQVLGISGQAIMTFGGVGGLALGLATRDIVANLVSGLLLLLRQPFTIGEEIKSGTRRGTVKEVGWLSTLIEEADGSPTFIPNRAMMQVWASRRAGKGCRRKGGGGFGRGNFAGGVSLLRNVAKISPQRNFCGGAGDPSKAYQESKQEPFKAQQEVKQEPFKAQQEVEQESSKVQQEVKQEPFKAQQEVKQEPFKAQQEVKQEP